MTDVRPNYPAPLTFSVVVNTCDRAGPLRTLLYSLNRQTYPHFEVVVVLGPSQDDSERVVAEFEGRVILVRCPVFNLSTSRNLGIAAAAGDVIAFIDDDAVPCLTWLEQLAGIFGNDVSLAGAGGVVHLVHPIHGRVQFRHGKFSLFGEDRDVRMSPDEEIVSETPAEYWYPRLMGTNMAYRRQALVEVGGFDERFAYLYEEPDLAIRLAMKGYRIHQSGDAIVYHSPVSSRNREVYTSNINWYAAVRGIIYFSFKNAGPIVGKGRTMLRCLRHSLFFLQVVREKRQYGEIAAERYPTVRRQVLRGIVWGFGYGLLMPRRLLRDVAPAGRPVHPFLVHASPRYPHLAPSLELGKQSVSVMSREPLRICLLSNSYPPGGTEGVGRLTHLMAQGISELGHEVHVIKQGKVDRTTFYDGAYVHEVQVTDRRYRRVREAGYSLTAWCLNYSHAVYECVRSLIVNHRIQVVDSPLWQFEGLVAAFAGQVPVVTRLVTSARHLATLEGYVNAESSLIGDLEEQLTTLSAGLVPISRSIRDSCAQLYGIDFASRLHSLIPAGIKPLAEEQISYPSEEYRSDPVVLFVGRLEKRKGVLSLFEAIPLVRERFPEAQFWFVGKDNSEFDGFAALHHLSYSQYFRKRYRAHADHVSFHGYVDDARLSELYDRCSVFVAPSLYESFGLIFLEAMNHARPTIGCGAGGPLEIVVDGETGLLVPPDSAEALAAAILNVLENPALQRSMGIAGRQRLLREFSYRTMADRYVEFYRLILDQAVTQRRTTGSIT